MGSDSTELTINQVEGVTSCRLLPHALEGTAQLSDPPVRHVSFLHRDVLSIPQYRGHLRTVRGLHASQRARQNCEVDERTLETSEKDADLAELPTFMKPLGDSTVVLQVQAFAAVEQLQNLVSWRPGVPVDMFFATHTDRQISGGERTCSE